MTKLTNEITKLRFALWDEPISSTKGTITSISWLSLIGRIYTNKPAIEPIRKEFLENGKSKKYKQLKMTLPSFMPQVSKADGRMLNQVNELSGILYYDIDFNPSIGADQTPNYYIQLAEQAKEQLKADPYVYACWLSISKAGLGIMLKVPGLTTENFNNRWQEFQTYLKNKYDLPVDEKVHNVNRLCFISWDTEPHINDDAIKFPFTEDSNSISVKNGITITVLPDKPPIFTPPLTTPTAVSTELVPPPMHPPIGNRGESTEGHPPRSKVFYKESKLDTHFPEILKNNKVDGINVRFDGKDHYWFAVKQPVVRLVTGRRKKLRMGERYSNLLKQLVTLVWLHPHWNREEIFSWILHYNRTWCTVPLSLNEMNNMMNHVYDDLRPKKQLSPCIVYKHNHYTSHAQLNRSQKLSKSGRAKKNKTQAKLVKGLIKCIEQLTIPNNVKVAELSNVSRPTTSKRIRSLNVEGVKNYIQTTIAESKEYEGVILEFMPDFEKMIYGLPEDEFMPTLSNSNLSDLTTHLDLNEGNPAQNPEMLPEGFKP